MSKPSETEEEYEYVQPISIPVKDKIPPVSNIPYTITGGGAGGVNYATDIDEVPVTKQRPVSSKIIHIHNAGMPRVNEADDIYHPHGTKGHPQGRSVLQQHVDFFDRNKDGIITPWETFQGFRALGFNFILSLLAILIIHPGFSLVTCPWVFDPLMRIWIGNIHRAKHGSDTGVYDTEGRFIPQKFEEIFSKWDKDDDGRLSLSDLLGMTQDLWVSHDYFGWVAAKFEWFIVWLLCADEDWLVSREKIRGVYDGSLFYQIERENILQSQPE